MHHWPRIPESYVTQVPILSLDRVLSNTLHAERSLILVDIDGAEFMMLQGAKQTSMTEHRPIGLVEVSSYKHQPAGVAINPRFAEPFDLFFEQGYQGVTADLAAEEITAAIVQEVVTGRRKLTTHNFVFIKR